MPTLFREWDQSPDGLLDAGEVERMYERGFAGATYSEEEEGRFADEMPNANGVDLCHDLGYADSAVGELVIPFVAVEETYPGCWPGSAQRRGDCVSHSQRNAMLTTLVGEVVAGLPDEVSGRMEEAPQVSPEAQRDGVLATEAIYRHRGHRGDGWQCSAAARVSTQTTGSVLRRRYEHADLTRYNPKWAGGKAGSDERDAFDDNLFREATSVGGSFETIRDLLARGFGVSSCGSEGFAKTRNEDGVAKRSGRWAHAMAYIGADDRDETKRKYSEPLVLVLNSWGPRWIRGGDTILGTNRKIPPGSFWARWSDVKRRSCYAMSGHDGWARRKLPDYLGGWQ